MGRVVKFKQKLFDFFTIDIYNLFEGERND
jgi:hypothetical protein